MLARQLAKYVLGGWGRRAAWVALVVFAALQLAAPSLFHAPRAALFDLYQFRAPRLEHASPVVIVAIDDASLKEIGQWPWPRQLLAELVKKLRSAQPKVIGIDIILPEPDRSSPEEWLRDAGKMPEHLRRAIRALPSHDALFADAISAGPTVLGIGGLWVENDGGAKNHGPLPPVRMFDPGGSGNLPPTLPHFNITIRSITALDNAAIGHGLISVEPDSDGVFRRLPTVSNVAGQPAASFSLEIMRLAMGAPWLEFYIEDDVARGVAVADVGVPTQDDGSVWVHFSPHDGRRFLSAADVLHDRIPADAFREKVHDAIVLVGVTGLGTTDLRLTPAGYMPGIEIHAQFLENVRAKHIVRRPNWTRIAEPALTFVFGTLLIVSLPLIRSRWQVLSLIPPFFVLAVIGAGFWQQLLLVDVATPALGLTLAFVSFWGASLVEADAHRRQLRRELEAQKLAAARIEGEMEAARRIQLGMLPGAASVAGDARFDLGALMVPARQIGGDLYDFFKVDAHRLFFAVGDVSGKGVPAALFMALGKSLCKSYALKGETDVGTIINFANAEIARDNPEMLFITMFAGIIDLDSGEVRFCNAGHDAPYVLRKDAPPQAVTAEGGPPLCVVEDFAYRTETLRLKPGELLCVMTDGVAEAMDATGALLGGERTKQILAAMPPGASAKTVVDELYAGVGRFVGRAEPSDDLTVLAIRWNGPSVP